MTAPVTPTLIASVRAQLLRLMEEREQQGLPFDAIEAHVSLAELVARASGSISPTLPVVVRFGFAEASNRIRLVQL